MGCFRERVLKESFLDLSFDDPSPLSIFDEPAYILAWGKLRRVTVQDKGDHSALQYVPYVILPGFTRKLKAMQHATIATKFSSVRVSSSRVVS